MTDDLEEYPVVSESMQAFNPEFLEAQVLEQATGLAAEIIFDLTGKDGALRAYIMDKRDNARVALARLIDADPTSPVQIIEAQEVCRFYLDVCEWVKKRLEAGQNADSEIAERWGTDGRETRK